MEGDCVFLVEDDAAIREGIRDLLEDAGHRVVCVQNGQAALDKLNRGLRPFVIILDLLMPVMDGATLRRRLLGDAGLRSIPVVLMTASAREAARGVAADRVLFKPIKGDDLIAAITAFRLAHESRLAPAAPLVTGTPSPAPEGPTASR